MKRPRLRTVLFPVAALAIVAAVVLVLRVLPDGGAGDARPPAPALVFAEFGATADRVYTAPPVNPDRRTLVATIEHAEGWGINPAPTMAGALVAYTVLPPGGPGRRDAPAELWLLDVQSRDRTRLARDADLLVAPVFNLGGGALAYRSTSTDGEQRLMRVNLETRARRVMHAYRGTFGLFPVGFESGGALLFAQLSNAGTDVFRVDGGRRVERLFHASDDIARDWRPSPDGASLSFLAPELLAERVVHRLRVVTLDGGAPRSVAAGAPLGEQFAPVWTPAGDAVTVGQEAYPALSASALTLPLDGRVAALLPPPTRGFDAPLGWSADGRYLAVRTFDGVTAYEPGRESMAVISTDGERRLLTARTELIFIGWLASG